MDQDRQKRKKVLPQPLILGATEEDEDYTEPDSKDAFYEDRVRRRQNRNSGKRLFQRLKQDDYEQD